MTISNFLFTLCSGEYLSQSPRQLSELHDSFVLDIHTRQIHILNTVILLEVLSTSILSPDSTRIPQGEYVWDDDMFERSEEPDQQEI